MNASIQTTDQSIVTLVEGTRIRVPSIFDGGREITMGVGFIAEGDSGRQVWEGPLVPGPWAYTYSVAVIIDASPVKRPPVIRLAIGSLVSVNGDTYAVTPGSRWERPDLAAV